MVMTMTAVPDVCSEHGSEVLEEDSGSWPAHRRSLGTMWTCVWRALLMSTVAPAPTVCQWDVWMWLLWRRILGNFEKSKSIYFWAHLVHSILMWLTRRPVALQLSGGQARPSDKKHLEDRRKMKVILIYRLQQPSSSPHNKQYLHRIY